VREVTDLREEPVVVFGRDAADAHSDRSPQLLHRFQRPGVRPCGRRRDAEGVLEEVGPRVFDPPLLTSGHRMAADEVDGRGQDLLGIVHHRLLGAADVGDDGAARQGGGDLLQDWPEEPDGGAKDDDVCPSYRSR
jgi:hypothetical protein